MCLNLDVCLSLSFTLLIVVIEEQSTEKRLKSISSRVKLSVSILEMASMNSTWWMVLLFGNCLIATGRRLNLQNFTFTSLQMLMLLFL